MRKNTRKPFVKREEKEEHRINEKIIAREIRLVIEGQEPMVVSTSEAIKMADEQELDLVEISPNAVPPVCKIMDYRKFLYNQKRKQKELKAKQSKIVLKEVRFGPNTDDHDFNFKLAHARKFLEEGSKVKAYVFFRGRTIVFKDRGEILLLKFAQELSDIGAVEQLPKLEGKRMIIMINPKKNK
ncbi:MAG: translation initiation factor IF-3 [Crocinitomicaceae bacterium]|jgi:translation initiation factor IF-3|nr:translation initiation factor IF-3 [Crocinitomicaceae bacterium]MCF8433956.1 translation initiation factor IF-3 [Crocinitomicaceae bacterium]MDP4683093.1 translation initiation factor IF-3 [Crocinitomicaceae bacterium]MDP4866529.1 translation initiation factor IF-3 [Crocinitomicaceae bacterium]MDP5011661.1 translation initiation factor IF-3 [Crocinitomicaceae bacterium]